jgi:hypothetical protein
LLDGPFKIRGRNWLHPLPVLLATQRREKLSKKKFVIDYIAVSADEGMGDGEIDKNNKKAWSTLSFQRRRNALFSTCSPATLHLLSKIKFSEEFSNLFFATLSLVL